LCFNISHTVAETTAFQLLFLNNLLSQREPSQLSRYSGKTTG